MGCLFPNFCQRPPPVEGLCEDGMEVVDQFTSDECAHINDDMEEDANDAMVDVLTSREAYTGDVCADEAITAKVSDKVEYQAMDEDDDNECLLGMIAGAHPSFGSPPGFEMPIRGCFMDRGDQDLVFVPERNIPYFRRNEGNWHQIFHLYYRLTVDMIK